MVFQKGGGQGPSKSEVKPADIQKPSDTAGQAKETPPDESAAVKPEDQATVTIMPIPIENFNAAIANLEQIVAGKNEPYTRHAHFVNVERAQGIYRLAEQALAWLKQEPCQSTVEGE